MGRQAFLFYTHAVTEAIKAEITELANVCAVNPMYEVFATGCCDASNTLDELASDTVSVKAYVRDDLRSLPYEKQLARVDWATMRYSADLALMQFYRDHPDFDNYWIIEYDVRFTGKWGTLIDELAVSNADLLCSYLTQYRHSPEWMHWSSFSSGAVTIRQEELCRAFFPVARLSNRLMRTIDERCKSGWAGQYEVLWTTIAKLTNGLIEEIGGTGPAVPPERRGKYYFHLVTSNGLFLSTFGAWPSYSIRSAFSSNSPRNILWHPVKE